MGVTRKQVAQQRAKATALAVAITDKMMDKWFAEEAIKPEVQEWITDAIIEHLNATRMSMNVRGFK